MRSRQEALGEGRASLRERGHETWTGAALRGASEGFLRTSSGTPPTTDLSPKNCMCIAGLGVLWSL